MKIKIEAVNGISLLQQCRIVEDYILYYAGNPEITKKGTGHKMHSRGRNYHINCHKTRTMWVFKIWWAV